VGADAWQVHPGDVDGWVWGDGSATPPRVTFEEVCPATDEFAAAPEAATITAAPLPTPADPRRGAGRGLGLLAFGAFALGLVIWLVIAQGRS
jgi:ferric-dicitrate binding protein FerR (iron transport regulator)